MADTSLSEKKIGLLIWQVSNYWQNKLRNILKKYDLTLNEYLILETLITFQNKLDFFSQTIISSFSGIDVSVVSVNLKLLEKKKLIKRTTDKDNRKKIITMLPDSYDLFNKIFPLISHEENVLFSKLQNEQLNFTNSLRLILGKKIRIKANKNP